MKNLAKVLLSVVWLIASGIALIICAALYPIVWIFDAARKADGWQDPYDKGYDRPEPGSWVGIAELCLVLIFTVIFIATILLFSGI